MEELRRHLWLPDDVSLCQLARNTGQIEMAGVPAKDVPACGPCLVAVSTFGLMAKTLMEESPSPVQSVSAATEELLSSRFAQVGHAETVRATMERSEAHFEQWFTVVLASGVQGDDPTSPDAPAGGAVAGLSGRATSDWPDDDLATGVA
jgi:hypothetical protein